MTWNGAGHERLAVTEGEFALQVGDGDALALHQDQEVVQEVGGFVDEAGTVAVNGFDDRLAGFFHDFLADSLGPLDK